jgi:hypothetical protein
MASKTESEDKKEYKINISNLDTIESIQLFIELLGIQFVPANDEIYKKYKSILIEK